MLPLTDAAAQAPARGGRRAVPRAPDRQARRGRGRARRAGHVVPRGPVRARARRRRAAWGSGSATCRRTSRSAPGGAIRNVAGALADDPDGAVVILNGDVLSGHDLARAARRLRAPARRPPGRRLPAPGRGRGRPRLRLRADRRQPAGSPASCEKSEQPGDQPGQRRLLRLPPAGHRPDPRGRGGLGRAGDVPRPGRRRRPGRRVRRERLLARRRARPRRWSRPPRDVVHRRGAEPRRWRRTPTGARVDQGADVAAAAVVNGGAPWRPGPRCEAGAVVTRLGRDGRRGGRCGRGRRRLGRRARRRGRRRSRAACEVTVGDGAVRRRGRGRTGQPGATATLGHQLAPSHSAPPSTASEAAAQRPSEADADEERTAFIRS